MRLIIITTEKFFDGEAEAVNLLFENGMAILHFRKPFASQDETEKFIKLINRDFHSLIVLHDHYELSDLYNLKGIHLNSRNQVEYPPSGDGKRGFSMSCSRHSLEDVTASRFYDYVFLSPVFDSISKVGYKQAFTPQQLIEAKERNIINENVIALGGITAENIPLAHRYGFGGVAVLGALWLDFAGDRNVNELLKRFYELKSIV